MSAVVQQPIAWGAYLPYLVARELAAEPHRSLAGRERRLTAVILFADISGFTAISEALAGVGRGGAEELTGLLNAYLAPAIATVEQYGGSVGKLGGDALTAVFPFEADQRGEVARRALACALAIQAHVAAYADVATSAGPFTLAMRIGMAAGPLLCTVVGAPSTRLELVLAGGVLEQAATAERAARPGEVMVSADLVGDLGPVAAEARGPASALYAVRAMAAPPPPAPRQQLAALPSAASRQAIAFLHPAIARRLESGQASFVNEHRAVTVLFAAFPAPDADQEPQAAVLLQRYLGRVFQVVRRYGGYVNKVDMGDKGSTFLALFGAPLSYEDDAARALHCALELRALASLTSAGAPPEPPAQMRIGVAAGLVYCGEVGSSSHREYTVIGDAVNLAARLMERARPGEIVAAEAPRRAAGPAFAWGETADLQIRGRSARVSVSQLAGLSSGDRAAAPSRALVGRSDELAALQALLDAALAGHGRIGVIVGDAGIGKSALANTLLEHAARRGARCLSGECLSYRTASPYLVWREPLRHMLGVDAALPAEAQLAQLSERLSAIDPRMLQRLPLLATALNLSAPESDLTRDLDPALRRSALESLVVDLIEHSAAEAPLAILLEGCDWIDPLSLELLEGLGRRLAAIPALVLLTCRQLPARGGGEPPQALGQAELISLAELPAREAQQLISQTVARLYGPETGVTMTLASRIAQRAQGNPFYIEELISLAHDRGLNLADDEAVAALELPESLHHLILSRIDRLSGDAQTALKVASVIGREFSPRWLAGVYPPLGDDDHLGHGLDELRRSDLAVLEHGGPDPAYLFKHVLTREVAYASLARATRAELHERAGAFIERAYAGELDRHLDLLAYHYGLSDNQIKQREYLARAGEAAYVAGASSAAADFFRRLAPLVHRHERSAVLTRLGMACRLSGRWDEAEAVYQEALGLASDRRTIGRCRFVIGELLLRRGDFAGARLWLEQARADFAAIGDPAGEDDALEMLGMVAYSQGDSQTALATLEDVLARAAGGADRARTLSLLNNIGLIYWNLGDLARALDCFERGLRLAVDLGSRRHIGVTVGNMGNIYAARGDYGRAIDCYSQKLQFALDVGDRLEVGISILNLGTVYEGQGEYLRANACYLRSLEIAMELGDRLGVGLALWGAGTAALSADHLATAAELLDRAEQVLRGLDAQSDLAACLLSQAELAVRRRNPRRALELLGVALALAEASRSDEIALRCRLIVPVCAHTLGYISMGQAADVVSSLHSDDADDAAQAAIHYTLVQIDGARAEDRTSAARLYRALHSRTPNAEYRRRYAELMGVALAPPPALPALPAVVADHPPPVNLLVRADEFIGDEGGLAREVG